VTALYDRMLRHTVEAGHADVVFGTIGAFDTALWDIKAQAVGEPLWRLLGGNDRMVHAYASGLDIGLTDDEPVATYQVYAERGLRAAKLKGGLDIDIRIDETVMTAARQRTAHAPDGPRIRPEQAGRGLLAVTPGPCRSTAEGTFDTMEMEDR
jgi:L-alanine-DL-glutamate epimerase-like enolase superfamily enzyme